CSSGRKRPQPPLDARPLRGRTAPHRRHTVRQQQLCSPSPASLPAERFSIPALAPPAPATLHFRGGSPPAKPAGSCIPARSHIQNQLPPLPVSTGTESPPDPDPHAAPAATESPAWHARQTPPRPP